MSKAMECDSCGVYAAESKAVAWAKLNVAHIVRIDADGYASDDWFDVHLCPKCAEAKLSFLEGWKA